MILASEVAVFADITGEGLVTFREWDHIGLRPLLPLSPVSSQDGDVLGIRLVGITILLAGSKNGALPDQTK